MRSIEFARGFPIWKMVLFIPHMLGEMGSRLTKRLSLTRQAPMGFMSLVVSVGQVSSFPLRLEFVWLNWSWMDAQSWWIFHLCILVALRVESYSKVSIHTVIFGVRDLLYGCKTWRSFQRLRHVLFPAQLFVQLVQA